MNDVAEGFHCHRLDARGSRSTFWHCMLSGAQAGALTQDRVGADVFRATLSEAEDF